MPRVNGPRVNIFPPNKNTNQSAIETCHPKLRHIRRTCGNSVLSTQFTRPVIKGFRRLGSSVEHLSGQSSAHASPTLWITFSSLEEDHTAYMFFLNYALTQCGTLCTVTYVVVQPIASRSTSWHISWSSSIEVDSRLLTINRLLRDFFWRSLQLVIKFQKKHKQKI
jgi:hypothetical protein